MNLAAFSDNALTLHVEKLQDLLVSFQQTLEQEHLILKTNNPSKLLEILPSKQQKADEISNNIQMLASNFQVPTNLTELKNLAAEASQPDLVARLEEIIQLSATCKELNIQNGITITAIENINNQLINIFSQPSEKTISLYDASGSKNQSKSNIVLGKA